MMTWNKLGLVGSLVLGASVIACSGSDGAQGPAGAPGAAGPAGPAGSNAVGTESVSAITPARAFLARTIDVEIAGFGTNWSDTAAPTVDFGAGITVKKVTVASPTGLLVNIQVGKTAATGPHDVTVSAGGKKDVFKGAFRVDSPMTATLTGTVAQGSVIIGHLTGKDLSTPFDTTTQGDGFFTPITYPNLNFTPANGVDVSVSSASIYGVDFLMLADVTAPTAAQTLELQSGAGTPDDFPLPNAFTLAARTGKPVTFGTPLQGNAQKPYDSELYTVTPTAASLALIDLAVTSTVSGAKPALVLLPKSGKFVDLIKFAATHTVVSNSADPYYAIFWDNTGTTGAYTITSKSTPAIGAAVAANSTTKGAAQTAASLPYVMQNGTLASATDQHWVKYTAVAADVGKKFHVVTYDNDKMTDTLVDVQTATGTSLGGPSSDTGYHEDFKSSPITAAGDHYIIVSASPQGYNAAHKTFNAWIRLE